MCSLHKPKRKPWAPHIPQAISHVHKVKYSFKETKIPKEKPQRSQKRKIRTGRSISHHRQQLHYGKLTALGVKADENHWRQHFWQDNPLLSMQWKIVSLDNCLPCVSFNLAGTLNWPANWGTAAIRKASSNEREGKNL